MPARRPSRKRDAGRTGRTSEPNSFRNRPDATSHSPIPRIHPILRRDVTLVRGPLVHLFLLLLPICGQKLSQHCSLVHDELFALRSLHIISTDKTAAIQRYLCIARSRERACCGARIERAENQGKVLQQVVQCEYIYTSSVASRNALVSDAFSCFHAWAIVVHIYDSGWLPRWILST